MEMKPIDLKKRVSKTIHKDTADFIKRQAKLRQNIEEIKQRSKKLLEALKKVESKIKQVPKKKRKKKMLFNPKDLHFDLMMKKVDNLIQTCNSSFNSEVKKDFADILNNYLNEIKKSKLRSQTLVKTKSCRELPSLDSHPQDLKSFIPNRKRGLSMHNNDMILFPIETNEEEQRKTKNKSLFLFPYIQEDYDSKGSKGDYETADSAEHRKEGLILFPIPSDRNSGNENNSLTQKEKLILFPK